MGEWLALKQLYIDTTVFERLVDFCVDKRLPHALPFSLWRKYRYGKSMKLINSPTRIHLCLTFDIEHDFRNSKSTGSTGRFLPKYLQWADKHGIKSTLYVQGDLLPDNAESLRPFLTNHELGLHGLHHEVWGRSRWWQYSQRISSIPTVERERRLVEALERFDRVDFPRPKSFRAPYLNIDKSTMRLLEKHGFTSDSSFAVDYGALPTPNRRGKLWEVSVAADPAPVIMKKGLKSYYRELSMGVLFNMAELEFLDVVERTLALQAQSATSLPFVIVLLGHPWEFEKTSGVKHASPDNFDNVYRYLDILNQHYNVAYSTVSEILSS